MATRVYRSGDLRKALADARSDLGVNMTILMQRQVPSSRWPFSRLVWEVIATDEVGHAAPPPPPAPAPAPLPEISAADLEDEIAELRNSLTRLVRTANLNRLPKSSQVLTDYYEMMCSRGMDSELSQTLVLAARDELSNTAQNQSEAVQNAIRRQLERELNIRPPRPTPGTGPLVIYVFGQTGVGKTTTLAKLALRQAVYDERKVAIVNADHMRAGAMQQLQALTKDTDILIESVAGGGAQALQSVLGLMQDRQVVFVDTPGCGRRDKDLLQMLAQLPKAATRRRTFLVMSANTPLDEMQQVAKAFRPVGIDGLIFSKLDETDVAGAVVTMACQSPLPVAYLTAGRRIPDDMEPATAERLSGLLFGVNATAEMPSRRVAKAKSPRAARPAPKAEETAKETEEE